MLYYFAYGSNMNHLQMKKRCPGSRFVQSVYLEGYKFVYDGYSTTRKGAAANIIESAAEIVWGGLWEINEEHRAKLNKYEGYPIVYDRKDVRVKNQLGEVYEALTYLRSGQPLMDPSEEYRKIVLQGARL